MNSKLERLTTHWYVKRVQIGQVRTHIDEQGKPWSTAIYKDSVETPIEVKALGLVGDERTGYDPDRALCLVSTDHYKFWKAYFGRHFPLGVFGENLTVRGAVDHEVCIGDIYQIGDVIMQVTQPRTPCYKQAKKIGEPKFVKLIESTHRRGFLVRILQEGHLTVRDRIQLLERPHPKANLVLINRIVNERIDLKQMVWLASIRELAHDWRKNLVELIEKKNISTTGL
jgi:MOSC domain-containing protein YiiM